MSKKRGVGAKTKETPHEIVDRALEEYARKGVFRGYSPGEIRSGRTCFKVAWHRDQLFECILDTRRSTIRFPVVLPEVPAKSEMDKALKDYVKVRLSDELPEHRRIDTDRAGVKTFNRGGNVSITLTVKDGDYEYAVRKLIHLVHEIYLDFLNDGRFYDYMIETFNLDPDHI